MTSFVSPKPRFNLLAPCLIVWPYGVLEACNSLEVAVARVSAFSDTTGLLQISESDDSRRDDCFIDNGVDGKRDTKDNCHLFHWSREFKFADENRDIRNPIGTALYAVYSVDGAAVLYGPVVLQKHDLSKFTPAETNWIGTRRRQGWLEVYVFPTAHKIIFYGAIASPLLLAAFFGYCMGRFS